VLNSSTRPHTDYIDSSSSLWIPDDGQYRPKHVVSFIRIERISKQVVLLTTLSLANWNTGARQVTTQSVHAVTRLRVGLSGVQILAGAKIFSLQNVKTCSVAHPSSCLMGTRVAVSEVEAAET
jgi:hypothetical protein